MGRRISGSLSALALLVVGGFASSAVARPLVPAERRYSPYDAVLPACDDPAPLGEIRSRFHDRESEFWKTGLEIVGFERVKEIGFRSNGLDYIKRRYCQARVQMNDDQIRVVSYSIDQDLGVFGYGFGIEWCVDGLDRSNSDAPNCKMARP